MVKIYSKSKKKIYDHIAHNEVTALVLGCDIQNLSLGVVLAQAGLNIVFHDTDAEIVNAINAGRIHLEGRDSSSIGGNLIPYSCYVCEEPLMAKKGTFCPSCGRSYQQTPYGSVPSGSFEESAFSDKTYVLSKEIRSLRKEEAIIATTDLARALKKSDVVFISKGYVVSPTGILDNTELIDLCHAIAGSISKEQVIVLTGPMVPGATEGMVKVIIDTESGYTAGIDYGLAYVHLRYNPSDPIGSIRFCPKVVSGVDQKSVDSTAAIFEAVGCPVFVAPNPRVAEMARLVEEGYRSFLQAFSFELANICKAAKIDASQVISLVNTSPFLRIFEPGVTSSDRFDYMRMLYRVAESSGYVSKVFLNVLDAYDFTRKAIIDTVVGWMKQKEVPFKDTKVTVLGISNAPNSCQVRGSSAIFVVNELIKREMRVIIHDPVADFSEAENYFPPGIAMERDLRKALRGSRCAILLMDHGFYRTMNLSAFKYMKKPALFVDARYALDESRFKELGIDYVRVTYA